MNTRVRTCLRTPVCVKSYCEILLQAGHSCSLNFCPDCANARFCDRTCGYCEDPCDGSNTLTHPGHVSDDPPATRPVTRGSSKNNIVLVSLACFTSFFCACSVVFAALTKRRVNARLGVTTTRASRRANAHDEDVLTVNATFTGFQVEEPSSATSSSEAGGREGLGESLLDPSETPVVVSGECSDSVGPMESTPGLGT